jgi:phosphatidylglycerol:prolipoprotein diacylglycerol transferase
MWCLLGFILLHFISKKFRKFDGQIFLSYVIWYGTGRFFIESLRTDSLYAGTLKASQVVAVISVTAAVVLLIIGFARAKRLGTDQPLYVDTEESKQLLAEADAREQAWQEKRGKKNAAAEETAAESILAEEFKSEETANLRSEEEIKKEKDAQIDALLDEIASKAEESAEEKKNETAE